MDEARFGFSSCLQILDAQIKLQSRIKMRNFKYCAQITAAFLCVKVTGTQKNGVVHMKFYKTQG